MTEGGTYKVVETSATKEVLNSGWESPTFVWKKFTALNLSYTAKDAIPTGYIGILKQDSEKNTPIQGVGFEVTAAEDIVAKVGNRSTVIYEKGEAITEGETNAEGKMVVKELPYGKYTVTETKHPEGYAAENVFFTVTVGAPSDYSASKVYTNPMIGYATGKPLPLTQMPDDILRARYLGRITTTRTPNSQSLFQIRVMWICTTCR